MSGVAGVGPNCERDRAQADQFRAQAGLPQQQASLGAINQEIFNLTSASAGETQRYTADLNNAIAIPPAEDDEGSGPTGGG